MKRLDFVLWMVGWPVAVDWGQYVDAASGRVYSENTIGLAALVSLIIWVVVARILWADRSAATDGLEAKR